jgi:cob(I)alamin adenosyltransferase
VKKASVYTRGGDKGETSLVSGNRISKSNARIDLYGDVDELNSFIGFACSELENKSIDKELYSYLQEVQSRLFDLGSNLACEAELIEKYKLPQITDVEITSMEKYIDVLNEKIEPLKNFILPGGQEIASRFHICRTVCRRIERGLVGFSVNNKDQIPKNSIQYINRLSDFFFIASRYTNMLAKSEEILWIPKEG